MLTTRSSIEGKQKLVTVLFADVANYTTMFEKNPKPRSRNKFGMTKKTEPNYYVMLLLNLGLMKIRLVSASDLLFLLSTEAPFIPVHRTEFSDEVLITDSLSDIFISLKHPSRNHPL